MMRGFFIALILLSASQCLSASEGSHIFYQHEPLQMQLQVGQEQHIILMSEPSVKVGMPASLRDKLSVTTIGSQVWLRADYSFADEKILLKTPSTQMILELSASVNYVAGETIYLSSGQDNLLADADNEDCAIGMVALVRYALQWAYAPHRLLNRNPCIRATNYPKDMIDIMRCLKINEAVCGGGVMAAPIAAWRTTEFYASLLELKNTLQTAITLDPRAIVGDFKAAAFAHHRLEAADSAQSVTALVVIGDKPLSRSIAKQRWLDRTSVAEHPTTP
ncbi:MAG: DUF3438 family protein [Chromatiales bacterium]|nr:DUF3438 family protein [Chromatiales bacterium]